MQGTVTAATAFEAGLVKDDLILNINGKDVSELSVTNIGEMFERAGNYRITVRRGDKTIELVLATRKLV